VYVRLPAPSAGAGPGGSSLLDGLSLVQGTWALVPSCAVFDRLTLTDDLVDCRGSTLARRGFVVSPESVAEAAQRAAPPGRRPLGETPLAAELDEVLEAPVYATLFRRDGVREPVARVLASAALPDVLVEELLLWREVAPGRLRHAAATAAVAVRMLLAAVGESRAVPDLAAAGLLHDIGMRQVPTRLHDNQGPLSAEDALLLAAHPLLGAYHLACVLGIHPAVSAARSHHWRCGQGYPGLVDAPSRSIEVVAVASTFAALTHPRPFRPACYDARGAADVLVAEAAEQHADLNTVKLLLHALRGGVGDPRDVRFGVPREGHGPEFRYQHVTAPARSPL
jgi:hypothetical protein